MSGFLDCIVHTLPGGRVRATYATAPETIAMRAMTMARILMVRGLRLPVGIIGSVDGLALGSDGTATRPPPGAAMMRSDLTVPPREPVRPSVEPSLDAHQTRSGAMTNVIVERSFTR